MRVEDYVGNRIDILCQKNKMSWYRLSQLTGISQSTISYLVKKETIPTLLTLEKICNAFNISIAQFFTEDKDLGSLSQEQIELLDMWQQLVPEEKRFVKTCIQSLQKKE